MNTNENISTFFKLKVETPKFEEVPDGVYEATVKKLNYNPSVAKTDGTTFEQLQWYFDIGKPFSVRGNSSPNLNKMSKAQSWIEAITGRMLSEGEDLTPELVEGKSCKVVIQKNDRNYPNVVRVLRS